MNAVMDTGRSIFDSTVSTGILATVAVILRLVANGRLGKGLTWDDYWVMLSLLTFWVYDGIMLWGVFVGGGGIDMPKIAQFDLKGISLCLKLLLIDGCLYAVSITAAKISILLFYRRIFWVHETVIRITTVLGVLSVCWCIVVVTTALNYCKPLEAHWNLSVKGRCINFANFFLVVAIAELLIDVSILCLPLFLVPKLRLELKYKIGVLCVFLLGGFVCVTAILRIQKIYIPGVRQVNHAKGILWTTVHLGVAIICACMPTYRPLVRSWRVWSIGSHRQHHSSKSSATKNGLEKEETPECEDWSSSTQCGSIDTQFSCTGMEDFIITFSPDQQVAEVR